VEPFSLIEELWWAGIPAAAVVGILLGASPLAWPLLATATGLRAGGVAGRTSTTTSTTSTTSSTSTTTSTSATVSASDGGPRDRVLVLALGAGVTTVYASLGLVTGQLERVIRDLMGAWSGVGYVLLAVVAAVGGLALLVRPTTSCRVLRTRELGGPGAFALGIPLGIVNCPACAGVITGVAVAAATRGSVAYSVLIMVALGVGHTLALLLVSQLAVGAARPLVRRAETVQRLGGGLLLASAGFFLVQVALRGTTVGPTLP
jgi:cytochrome c biogenesis protein CcdA